MTLTISYKRLEKDDIIKVSWSGLTMVDIYSALNDYSISSIYEFLEAHIGKEEK